MISKPTNLINAKLEEMYDSAMFWFYSSIQAIVFDANNFCYRISQLTQLTSLERFDQMNYAGQREESLQQIVSILREESLPLQCSKWSRDYSIRHAPRGEPNSSPRHEGATPPSTLGGEGVV